MKTNKNADIQIKEIKEIFDLYVSKSSDFFFIYTFFPKEKYLYVSDSVKKITGYPPKDFYKQHNFLTEKVHPDDLKNYNRISEESKKIQKDSKSKTINNIFRIKNKKGEYIFLEEESFLVKDEKGKAKYFVGIVKDINQVESQKRLLEGQNEVYKEIFDNIPVAIIMYYYGRVRYVNKAAKKILGVGSLKECYDYNLLDLIQTKKEKEKGIKRIKEIYKNKKQPETIFHIKNLKNENKIVTLHSMPIPGQDLGLMIISDKTEELKKQELELKAKLHIQENILLKKQNQVKQKLLEELTIKRSQLLNTINNSDYLFWITDSNLKIILFNQAFYNYCLKYFNLKITIGMGTEEIIGTANEINKESAESRKNSYKKILTSKETEYEVRPFNKEKQKHDVYKILLRPILDRNKKMASVYCYGHEITEKYDFINQIEIQSVKLTAIIQNSPIYLWAIDKRLQLTLFNNNYETLIETLYNESPKLNHSLRKMVSDNNKEFVEKINYHYKKAFLGSKENFQVEFIKKDYKKIFLDINLFPIVVNNEVKEVAGIAIDVSEEINKQRQLSQLLEEKEVLMKEIHHRTKNNLQVITSMLNLQVQNTENNEIKQALRDTQNRIYSMALIHQSLYQNKNYSSINISDNITSLVQNILYSFNKSDIAPEFDIEDIILDLNTSVPLSLIINEIITNIAKYAFPQGFKRDKKINISLKRTDHTIYFQAKDNGVGATKDKIENTNSTGFIIITSLAEQIGAELKIHSEINKGTTVSLTIPLIQ